MAKRSARRDLYAAVVRSAEDDNPNTRLIPGYGGYVNARKPARAHPMYDGAPSPAGRGPFKRKPPRARQSGSPDRYYANRPHRPRFN